MNDTASHTEMNPQVSKVAMTDKQGNALTDMRFSESLIRFETTTTVSIALERKVNGRWVLDADVVLHAQGIKPEEVADAVVDFIYMLHRQVMGHPPMGLIYRMEAPK